jgi:hypothetical protein
MHGSVLPYMSSLTDKFSSFLPDRRQRDQDAAKPHGEAKLHTSPWTR